MLNEKVYLISTGEKYPDFPYKNGMELHLALQRLFSIWGLDSNNPFKDFIKQGETALIKPNWVTDSNPLGYNIDSLITHTSLVKYLLDCLIYAMNGKGTIIIADSAIQKCDFNNLLRLNKLKEIVKIINDKYQKVKIIIEDWRLTLFKNINKNSLNKGIQLSLDNLDKELLSTYRIIDLGKESYLEEIADYSNKFRVANYKPSIMLNHHTRGKHEYLVTNRIFNVDFIINLPKMKTHKKAGLTGALKNLVGINRHKEYLPHYIKGAYLKGGDNYCLPNWFREKYEDMYDFYWEHFASFSVFKRGSIDVFLKYLWRLSRISSLEHISDGSWMGNDTVWRTILDLNHILYFKNSSRLRKVINIVDGIISGEGDGPLSPTPKPTGLLIGGENPAYIDAVIGQLMGYNISRLPTVYNAIYHRKSKFAGKYLEDLMVFFSQQNNDLKEIPFYEIPSLNFKKPHYWKGASVNNNIE